MTISPQQPGHDEDSMRARPEDKLGGVAPNRGGFPLKALVLVAVIGAGLFLLFYPDSEPEAPAPEPPQVAETRVEIPSAEDIPERMDDPPPAVGVATDEAVEGTLPPEPVEPALPAPDESDSLLREELAAVGAGSVLAGFAQGEQLLGRLVALVDGGSRGLVLRKILPMRAPREPFAMETVNGQLLYMSQAGYQRYDSYVDAVVALDTDAMVGSFHRLRALYEAAYAQLDMKAEDLDNAVIRILDRIIAAPEISEPLALQQKSVMYTYADPAIEALSPLQKQLLRMGPDNTRRLKDKANELRTALLAR
ncbi:MAG: DUF3014 domain-containing protein [Parahaliea sp.]